MNRTNLEQQLLYIYLKISHNFCVFDFATL